MSRLTLTTKIACLTTFLMFPFVAQAGDFDQTCTYFRNISFNDEHTRPDETFRLKLSRDCSRALSHYSRSQSGNAGFERAEEYLVQLHRYRRTLLDIASDRYVAARAGQDRQRALTGHSVSRQVSRTGAYLIARSMGLIGAQRQWHEWLEANAN